LSPDIEGSLEKSKEWIEKNLKKFAFKKLERQIIKSGICVECGTCVTNCPEKVLAAEEIDGKYTPNLVGKCTACGRCGQLCQFSAIICINDTVLTFEELCHSCGGCMAVCPEGAIEEKERKIGVAEFGTSEGIAFGQGKLNIGAVQTPALIRHVRQKTGNEAITILDVPPGTSCPVIEAISDSDFVLLVTEPTPFGLHDLELAVEMVRALELPFAVVINRSDIGDEGVAQFCQEEGIDVLLEIRSDRMIAEAYSRGVMMVDVLPQYEKDFLQLHAHINDRMTVR